jgi:Mn-containing catalase
VREAHYKRLRQRAETSVICRRLVNGLESMGKPAFSIGRIPPTAGLVDQYFNDSTGIGDRGEPDATGPWNEGGDWEMVTAPAFQEFESEQAGTRQPGNGSARNQ